MHAVPVLQSCATCQRALGKLRTVQRAVTVAAWATAAAALLCAAVAVTGTAAPAAASAAAASGVAAGSSSGGVLAGFGSGLLYLLSAVAGEGNAVQHMLRGFTWVLAMVLLLLGRSKLDGLEQQFYKGVYPPPRNAEKKD